MLEIWDLWMPSAGATGLSFARSRVEAEAAGDRLLVHAAPPELSSRCGPRTGRRSPRATTSGGASRAR